MPTFVREMVSAYLTTGGLAGRTLDWDRSRGGDFRCLAEAIHVIDKYSEKLNNHGTMLQLEKWLTSAKEPSEDFREKVHNTLNVFVALVQDSSLNGVFNTPTKVSPIEFIMIALFIAVHKDNLTPAQLSVALGEMRAHTRETHTDIRMNSRVSKTMVEFIKRFKLPRGKAARAGESAGALAKDTKKRKREVPDDEGQESTGDVKMRSPPLSTPEAANGNSRGSKPPARQPERPPPINRLAAIHAAKLAKNTSASLSIPVPSDSSVNPPVLRSPKIESPLENSLMARMAITTGRAPPPDSGRATRPRYKSRSRSRSRSRDRLRERDTDRNYERDSGRRRSGSSERSVSRPRKPYDGGRDWNYATRRGRDRP